MNGQARSKTLEIVPPVIDINVTAMASVLVGPPSCPGQHQIGHVPRRGFRQAFQHLRLEAAATLEVEWGHGDNLTRH